MHEVGTYEPEIEHWLFKDIHEAITREKKNKK